MESPSEKRLKALEHLARMVIEFGESTIIKFSDTRIPAVPSLDKVSDLVKQAKAALDLPKDDDKERMTVEWLNSLHVTLPLPMLQGKWTRGDVRRLCRIFGIEILKEKK